MVKGDAEAIARNAQIAMGWLRERIAVIKLRLNQDQYQQASTEQE